VGNRLQCHGSHAAGSDSNHLSCQRGRRGIGPEWLMAALTEVTNDDPTESGDTVRLLAQVAMEGVTNQPLSKEAWCGLCQHAKLLERWKKAEKPEVECAKQFHEAEEAVLAGYIGPNATVVGFVAERTRAVCAPMVLELLMQWVAAAEPWSLDGLEAVETLVGEILWERCGWDTPAGRRLLRRICRTFDRYAGGEEILSRTSFIKVCNDSGWSTERDHHAKHSRFSQVFTEAVGDSQTADFIDFLYMMEIVASEIVRPQRRHQPGTHGMWSALQFTLLQLSGMSPSSPRRRHGESSRVASQGALTVRQKDRVRNWGQWNQSGGSPRSVERSRQREGSSSADGDNSSAEADDA